MILSATVKPPLCLLHAIPTQDIRQRAERFSRLSTAAAQTAERAQWRQAIEEVCEPQLYPNAFSCFVWPACVCVRMDVRACAWGLSCFIGAFIQANQALSICPHVQHGDAAVTQLRVTNTRSFSMNILAIATINQSPVCLARSLSSPAPGSHQRCA